MRVCGFHPSPGMRLLGLAFPGKCLVCGQVSPGGPDLCPACQEKLAPTPLGRDIGFPAVAPFPYREGVQPALWRLKFHGERSWAAPLARWMADAAVREGFPADGVAWAPMSPKKKRRRGYDQAELLARRVARLLGIPALRLLTPTRETATQHDLSREERFQNVAGAYAALPGAAGKRLWLVDDILTTGATMISCGDALKRAGALEVRGLAAAMDVLEREEKS